MYTKNRVPFKLIKLRIITLNLLIDSVFLILLLSLLLSIIHNGKNEFSNALVLAGILAGISLIVFFDVERVRYFPFPRELW